MMGAQSYHEGLILHGECGAGLCLMVGRECCRVVDLGVDRRERRPRLRRGRPTASEQALQAA